MPLWSAVQKPLPSPAFPDLRLEGARVLVRLPAPHDWPAWSQARAKNKEALRPVEPLWAPDALTRPYFFRRLARIVREFSEGRTRSFLIFRKDTGALIGGINLNNIYRGAACHAALGYWLDAGHQGQGYMAEAARLVIHYAFADLGLHRINAASLPENQRSRALLKSLGFAEEGFAKSYLQIGGEWRDHVLYGLVAPGKEPAQAWPAAPDSKAGSIPSL